MLRRKLAVRKDIWEVLATRQWGQGFYLHQVWQTSHQSRRVALWDPSGRVAERKQTKEQIYWREQEEQCGLQMMHLHVLRGQCHHNLSLRASETTVGEHPDRLPTSPTTFSLHKDYWDKQQEGEACLVWTRKRRRCLSVEEKKGMVRMSSKK